MWNLQHRACIVRISVFPRVNCGFAHLDVLIIERYIVGVGIAYGVKASARFVKGKGQVYISGYDATRDEGVALEHNNLVVFMPESTGETLIEFTVSSRYGLPVRKQITIQVNP